MLTVEIAQEMDRHVAQLKSMCLDLHAINRSVDILTDRLQIQEELARRLLDALIDADRMFPRHTQLIAEARRILPL